MQDLLSMLNALRRPGILTRAARLGAQDYSRDRHLRRLLGYGDLPRPAAALVQLMEIERQLDDQRRTDEAGYSLTRHLDVMIALVGEAQLLQASSADLRAARPVT